MLRRTTGLLILAVVFLLQTAALAAPPPAISAETAVMMVAKTQQVIFAKDPDKRMYPASTTKMITLLTALELGDEDSVVTVSPGVIERLAPDGSSMDLKAGDRLTLRDLLTGMIMVSGNDAAEAVAEHIGGSVPGFVAMMNQKAASLGLVNTHFSNPHGMPDPLHHYSTAMDLAKIADAGLQNHEFARMVSTRKYTVEFLNRDPMIVCNTNKFLKSYQGANGVKTGSTEESGDCLVASATHDGVQLIVVLLNDDYRWDDVVKLLDYGFQQQSTCNLAGDIDR